MSTIISKICTAGHTSRCTAIRGRCECSALLYAKDSPEGKAIIAERASGKNKKHSAGYQGRDDKSGTRQKHRAFGDSETAVRV